MEREPASSSLLKQSFLWHGCSPPEGLGQGEGRMEEEHLHPFQACALISVPQPGKIEGGIGRGEEGDNSARSRTGILV